MAPISATAEHYLAELNPYVGQLADQLVSSLRDDRHSIDAQQFALLERMLSYATTAEQQLTEQQARIAYLESLSMTDELTGLHNRRGFDDAMKRTLSAANRYGEAGILAFFDLDQFKRVNDEHGHDAGDRCLRRVASVLSDNTRLTDSIARLGGDEFVVVLARTSAEDGERRAHHLQEALQLAMADSPEFEVCDGASLGTAPFDRDSDPNSVFQAADRAMYKNKAARGQRAVVALYPAPSRLSKAR